MLAADFAVLRPIRAVVKVHAHAGNGGKGHVLQQPQFIGAIRQDGLGGILVEVLVEQRRPLAEQVAPAVVERILTLALRRVGVDGPCVVPNRLQQAVFVNFVQHGGDGFLRVVVRGDGGAVEQIERDSQKFYVIQSVYLLIMTCPGAFCACRGEYGPR